MTDKCTSLQSPQQKRTREPTPALGVEQKCKRRGLQQENTERTLNSEVFALGIGTMVNISHRFSQRCDFQTVKQHFTSGKLFCHQVVRRHETKEFYVLESIHLETSTQATLIKSVGPEADFDDYLQKYRFFFKTRNVSDHAICRTINGVPLLFKPKRSSTPRAWTRHDVRETRISLDIFHPESTIDQQRGVSVIFILNSLRAPKERQGLLTQQSESRQLAFLRQNARESQNVTMTNIIGNCKLDVIIYNSKSQRFVFAGLKHCTKVLFVDAQGSTKATFANLKPHGYFEIMTHENGHIVIPQSNRDKSQHVYFSPAGNIRNLTVPHVVLPRNHDVLTFVTMHPESLPQARAMEVDLASLIMSYSSRIGAIGELFIMMLFGGYANPNTMVGTADVIVNNIKIQVKTVATRKNGVQFRLVKGAVSYAEMDLYVYCVIANPLMRLYQPMVNATINSILKGGTKSFGTRKLDTKGFPRATETYFEAFHELNIFHLVTKIQNAKYRTKSQNVCNFLSSIRKSMVIHPQLKQSTCDDFIPFSTEMPAEVCPILGKLFCDLVINTII